MNRLPLKLLICSILIAGSVHAETTTIETGINVFQVLRELSLDDKLTILSVGRLKALVSKPEIAETLQEFEAIIDMLYRKALAEAHAHNATVDELVFKQKIVLALYAALYKMAEQEIAESGTDEQAITLAQQLTPEQISEIFADLSDVASEALRDA